MAASDGGYSVFCEGDSVTEDPLLLTELRQVGVWLGGSKVIARAVAEIERLQERERMLLESHTGAGCGYYCAVCDEKGYT